MTVFHVKGCGRQMGCMESYRGQRHDVNLLPKVRLHIALNEEFVQPTIDAIVRSARSGNVGDGKIFVIPLDRCIRIRTGEEGNETIG
jgi:nitrogen regulatory protein P-II 1